MGLLENFEERLGKIVNGSFSKAFNSQVQPVELAAALQGEIDNRVTNINGTQISPNVFIFGLAAQDFERLSSYFGALANELGDIATKYCIEQRYTPVDRPDISFVLESALNTGDFRIKSTSAPVSDAPVSNSTATPAVPLAPIPVMTESVTPHLRTIEGDEYPLTRSVTNIGRGSEADIKVNDSGVSRIHCSIVLGSEVLIRDNGSTNGTLVDGNRITEAVLRDGSIIKVGNTTLTYASR